MVKIKLERLPAFHYTDGSVDDWLMQLVGVVAILAAIPLAQAALLGLWWGSMGLIFALVAFFYCFAVATAAAMREEAILLEDEKNAETRRLEVKWTGSARS